MKTPSCIASRKIFLTKRLQMLTLLYGRSVVGDHFTLEIITAGDPQPLLSKNISKDSMKTPSYIASRKISLTTRTQMLTLLYGRSVVGDHFTSEIVTAGDRKPLLPKKQSYPRRQGCPGGVFYGRGIFSLRLDGIYGTLRPERMQSPSKKRKLRKRVFHASII